MYPKINNYLFIIYFYFLKGYRWIIYWFFIILLFRLQKIHYIKFCQKLCFIYRVFQVTLRNRFLTGTHFGNKLIPIAIAYKFKERRYDKLLLYASLWNLKLNFTLQKVFRKACLQVELTIIAMWYWDTLLHCIIFAY